MVRNIQAVIPEQLSFIAPSSLSNLVGDGVSVQLTANSTVGGTLTYGASGLPSGLAINPTTGLISGTIAADADLFGPYQVTVTVTNGANSRLRTIDWAVTAPLPGDYNGSGVVDAADYTVWRDSGGSQGAYNIWKANFGNSFSPGGFAAGVVAAPEQIRAVNSADCVDLGAPLIATKVLGLSVVDGFPSTSPYKSPVDSVTAMATPRAEKRQDAVRMNTFASLETADFGRVLVRRPHVEVHDSWVGNSGDADLLLLALGRGRPPVVQDAPPAKFSLRDIDCLSDASDEYVTDESVALALAEWQRSTP